MRSGTAPQLFLLDKETTEIMGLSSVDQFTKKKRQMFLLLLIHNLVWILALTFFSFKFIAISYIHNCRTT